MFAVISIFIPAFLLLLLRIKVLQQEKNYYRFILLYLIYVIVINILSIVTLHFFFEETENIIFKLNSSITFTIKYFLLSSAFAVGLLIVQLLPARIKLSKKVISTVTMGLIYVPIVIFLFGFTKIYWAILTSICISYCFYGFLKRTSSECDGNCIVISKNIFLTCFFLCFIVGIICGWGGLFQQTDDWHKANAVLRDLINYDWPVYYVNGDEHSALSYYIAGYLIPALSGKLFNSFDIAEFTMLVYFVIGLFVLLLDSIIFIKISDSKKIIVFLIGMILFSGALILAQNLVYLFYPNINSVGNGGNIYADGIRLQYRSTVVNLQWVPTQYIFPCLAGITFLNNKKDVQNYVWYLLPILLYSGFAFIGVFPIALISAFIYVIRKEIDFKKIFSVSNISMALTLGLILIFYFWGNITSIKPDSMKFQFVSYDKGRLLGVYLIFCLFMFGIQAILVWNRNKSDPIFISVILILMVIPFEKMGNGNDWVLGSPAIPLFFLMLFIWDFIFNEQKNDIKKGILITILCIGAIYPIRELGNTTMASIQQYSSGGVFKGRADDYGTMQKYANRSSGGNDTALIYNYFNYDLDNDIFYRYIARK